MDRGTAGLGRNHQLQGTCCSLLRLHVSPAHPFLRTPFPLHPLALVWSHPRTPKEMPGLYTSLGKTLARCVHALASTAPREQGSFSHLLIPPKN